MFARRQFVEGRCRRPAKSGSFRQCVTVNYLKLPTALGCQGWFTAKVTTLGEIDAALARASTGESACYIEVVGGKLDFPASLALAHQRLDAMYENE
jgi:indolepyruvate decarboxylase